MEISPIAGIVSLPVVKAPPLEDVGLVVVSDVENTARSGDETYTPSGGESAGGGEDEFEEAPKEEESGPQAANPEESSPREISFFA